MKNLTTNELFGRIFFRCSDLRPIDGYFSCLNSVKSLLESPNFKSSTSGFYINVSEGVNSVRLSYFTSNRAETEGAIQGFSDENSNIRIFKREEPHVAEVSRGYGDEELRFRKFLHTYTQIRFIGLHKSHFFDSVNRSCRFGVRRKLFGTHPGNQVQKT